MPSRAAILTYDDLLAEIRRLRVMADSYRLTNETAKADRLETRAAQRQHAADIFAQIEGLTQSEGT